MPPSHRLATLALLAARCVALPHRSRDYATDYQSQTFFFPRQVKIDGVGLLNEDTAFVATRSGIKALHSDGPPTPLIEVEEEEITGFHLCHHRSSIIYEVLARDGGALSIYEYSIPVRATVKVKEFQDAAPAASLACADEWLLRVSPSALLAVHLATGVESELQRYQGYSDAVVISMSVAYAADVVSTAEVFIADRSNRTISRLRLSSAGEGKLREESFEHVLVGGDGSDGPLETATVHSPEHVAWASGKVFFTDGCALRELYGGRVRSILGHSACLPAANETLEPVPWATRLSRPVALAVASEGTAGRSVLLLTEAQVVRTMELPNACVAASSGEHKCSELRLGLAGDQQRGCGWAEGPDHPEALCFECSALERWAVSQRPAVDACSLELSTRQSTRYSLSGCGCKPPPPDPAEREADLIQENLAILLAAVIVVAIVLLYRRGRQIRNLQDAYEVDTAEFHTFTDADPNSTNTNNNC